jgi:hypothetical protein
VTFQWSSKGNMGVRIPEGGGQVNMEERQVLHSPVV